MDKPIEYEQYDSRWKDIMYSNHNDARQTIGTSACGTTTMAMVIATLRDTYITPKEMSAWSVANGHRSYNAGTKWSFFSAMLKKYNIPYTKTSYFDKASEALKQNLMVITSAGRGIWTKEGHIFLAYGLMNNYTKVLIHDPNSEAPYKELANITNYRVECGQFWIIKEEWKMEIKDIQIKHAEKGMVEMQSVNVNDENFVRLRDTEKIAPIKVGWDGKNPTIKVLIQESGLDIKQLEDQIKALEDGFNVLKALLSI